jgi:hypothetical protein
MFLRRRTRTSARQVRVSLPRGRQLEVNLPRTPTLPWARRPAPNRWTRPPIIAGAVAALAAAAVFLTGLLRRRGPTADERTPVPPASAHGAAGNGAVTSAIQQPTSDREPDEIDRLANLDPAQTGASKRR